MRLLCLDSNVVAVAGEYCAWAAAGFLRLDSSVVALAGQWCDFCAWTVMWLLLAHSVVTVASK